MWLLAISMIVMLLLGFPFMVVLLGPVIFFVFTQNPGFSITVLVQQVINGINPPTLVAIPMFILAANIITSGQAAKRLIRMVKTFVGHLPGGLPITTNASCMLFGAVSGSTQATVAAVGTTMRPMLRKAGYSSPFTFALIINSSDVAFLIPPSVGFIVYGVVTRTSVGSLFLAGIGPGILIFILFSIYSYVYSRVFKINQQEKASWNERWSSVKEGAFVLGFPAIIIGGIYMGVFSPTEAAAVSVAYALLLEALFYRELTWKRIVICFLDTGIITGVVFILVGAGMAFSWLLSFMQLPQLLMPVLFGPDPSYLRVIIVVVVAYFIACMFVDPIVAIYILSPILTPYVLRAGVDPVLLGTLVVLQCAIGSATPPFGVDIFTAQLIFRRPYLEVIRETPPFILILLITTVLLIVFPDIALFIPNAAIGR